MNSSVCAVCERDKLTERDGLVMATAKGKKCVCFSCMEKITKMHGCYQDFVPYGSSFAQFSVTEWGEESVGKEIISEGKKIADDVLRPEQIRDRLNEYIIGQEHAKKTISVALYNHYKRNTFQDDSIKKSNILLVGPTGSGKTYLVETIAKIMKVPVALCTATTMTEAGYIGADVESMVARLFDVCDHDVEKTQRGIIFIDEIDKLCASSSDTEKKVGGKGVQQAMLRLLEGCVVSVPVGDSSLGHGTKVDIDTTNILFICGGAFPDMEEMIKERLNKKEKQIGFSRGNHLEDTETVESDILLHVTPKDLRKFGLIPELIGRLPVIAPLEELSIDTLVQILSVPKGSLLKQYQKLFDYDGIHLKMEDAAMTSVAELAIKIGTGARSLRSIMERVLEDLMFTLPGKNISEYIITKEYIDEVSKTMMPCKSKPSTVAINH